MVAVLPQQRQTSVLLLIISQFAQSTAEDSGKEVMEWNASPDIHTAMGKDLRHTNAWADESRIFVPSC
jgi:hypothetical protein